MMHCKTRTLLSDFVAVNSDIVMDGDVMNHVIISQCGNSSRSTGYSILVPSFTLHAHVPDNRNYIYTNHGPYQS